MTNRPVLFELHQDRRIRSHFFKYDLVRKLSHRLDIEEPKQWKHLLDKSSTTIRHEVMKYKHLSLKDTKGNQKLFLAMCVLCTLWLPWKKKPNTLFQKFHNC